MKSCAACAPAAAHHRGTKPATPLAALLLAALAVPAFAQDDFPRRKSGLWDMTMELPGPRGGTMASQHCVDEKSDGRAMRRALDDSGESRCTQSNVRRAAGSYDADYRCEGPRGKTEGTLALRGDLQSRYTMTNTMRFDPPRRGTSEARMTMTGTWKGACPADMKPGEIRMTGLPGRPPRPGAPK